MAILLQWRTCGPDRGTTAETNFRVGSNVVLMWAAWKRVKFMLIDQSGAASSFSFSGHETFPLRYTWLPKAVQRLEKHPDLFTRDDALVILGVGKNMVRSIRHWGRAFGILEFDRDARDQVTEFGEKLLGARGWDPYLEDPGTLWLLHWNVVSHPEKASTWYLAFTQWNQETFTRQELDRLAFPPLRRAPNREVYKRLYRARRRRVHPNLCSSGSQTNAPARRNF